MVKTREHKWSLLKFAGLFICYTPDLGANFVVCACSINQPCDAMDCSPPGSCVHGILQARILEWVAISFSNAWKWKVKVKSLSHARLLVTPWTAAHQAPPSMGFSRQEYWSGVPLPSPMQCYSAIKKNEVLIHATTWMNLENIIQSEISQSWKTAYYDSFYVKWPE